MDLPLSKSSVLGLSTRLGNPITYIGNLSSRACKFFGKFNRYQIAALVIMFPISSIGFAALAAYFIKENGRVQTQVQLG